MLSMWPLIGIIFRIGLIDYLGLKNVLKLTMQQYFLRKITHLYHGSCDNPGREQAGLFTFEDYREKGLYY